MTKTSLLTGFQDEVIYSHMLAFLQGSVTDDFARPFWQTIARTGHNGDGGSVTMTYISTSRARFLSRKHLGARKRRDKTYRTDFPARQISKSLMDCISCSYFSL